MNPELSTRELLELIGSDNADTLVELDHAHLSYGAHHRFAANTTIYNLAGLRLLAELFVERARDAIAADALVEPTDEQAAKTAALERASHALVQKVAELGALIEQEKQRRAADPVTVRADSEARQRAETPSRDGIPPGPKGGYWFQEGSMS